MLSVAAVGMFSYGAYSIGWALVDLIRGAHLEIWAELGLLVFGLLLIVSAALVRVRMPGGLVAAIGALLGLQALAVHNAVHLGSGVAPQVGRAMLAATLVVVAQLAESRTKEQPR